MKNHSEWSVSELQDVLINHENEEFANVQSSAIELINRGYGEFVKHFGVTGNNELNKSQNLIPSFNINKYTNKLNSVFLEFSKSFGTILYSIIFLIIINIVYIFAIFFSDAKLVPGAILGTAVFVSIINLVLFVIILYNIYNLTITSKDASNTDFNEN